MRYIGSKRRLAKHLAPIIQNAIDKYGMTTYLEPFVGGANMIEHIRCNTRIGYDVNSPLIGLYKYLQAGGVLPDKVTYDEYQKVLKMYRAGEPIPDWVVGCVGFLSSFRGKFFDGWNGKGYLHKNGGVYRIEYQEISGNLLNQIKLLQDVHFEVRDYRNVIPTSDTLIYCDPPYSNTIGYQNEFNSTEFWEVMREWSKITLVFISELSAPSDFIPIWSKDITAGMTSNKPHIQSEKLFIYNHLR